MLPHVKCHLLRIISKQFSSYSSNHSLHALRNRNLLASPPPSIYKYWFWNLSLLETVDITILKPHRHTVHISPIKKITTMISIKLSFYKTTARLRSKSWLLLYFASHTIYNTFGVLHFGTRYRYDRKTSRIRKVTAPDGMINVRLTFILNEYF